jgi:hypothetical protein
MDGFISKASSLLLTPQVHVRVQPQERQGVLSQQLIFFSNLRLLVLLQQSFQDWLLRESNSVNL